MLFLGAGSDFRLGFLADCDGKSYYLHVDFKVGV